jgi:hypothetical protein
MLKVGNEGWRSIGNLRIVLGIGQPDEVAHGLGGLALIEHQVIKARDMVLVAFQLRAHDNSLG